MRTVFFFIACSCLINGLTASFPGFALRDEETNFDNEVSPQLDMLFPDIKNADSLMSPYPTDSRPTSTTPPTTTALPSTTSGRPTRPPRPTRPTRPTPTTESTTTTTTTTSRPTRPPRPTRPTRPTPTTESTTTTTTTTSRPTRPPRPTRPTRPTPTTESTTTTSRPTRPPRPTRPTRPPTNPPALRPFPTSRPELDRVQVYKNAFRSLGPLAGRLVNVVANIEGNQKTAQQNEIVYNLRSFKANRNFLDEEEEYDSEV